MQPAEMTAKPMNLDAVVYFVDDDRGMVTSTSQWLSLSGVKVRAFAEPAALLKVIKPNFPCVVVSDIRMPGIDGLELMKLVHARESRIPVILITGHGDIPLAVEAMKQGAFEFLPKPFSPEKLLESVIKAQESWHKEGAANSSEKDPPQPSKQDPNKTADHAESDLTGQMEAYEKELIETAFQRHGGSITKVMQEFNIPRRTLNAKMKKYGIVRSDFRKL